MPFKYDVEVIFHFIGDKKNNIYEGYRPSHMIQEEYLTTGIHSYYNIEGNADEIKGMIAFISPEYYPHCLWIGKKIKMYEGSKLVGYATITQIFNPTLKK
jgi:elongation factor Tu